MFRPSFTRFRPRRLTGIVCTTSRVNFASQQRYSSPTGNVIRRISSSPSKPPPSTPTSDRITREFFKPANTFTASVVEGGIRLTSPSSGTVVLPKLWLRDHCRCAQCVNQDTLQKSFDTFSPESIHLLVKDVRSDDDGLHITWNQGDHVSHFSKNWLRHHVRWDIGLCGSETTKTTWGSDIASRPPAIHYDEIMADEAGVARWTSKIVEHGFCFVDGCPVSPEKTQELLERIAFTRVTHYGGFYDFTSDLTMKDTAYTSLALPAHTDTPYFTDPAGLQMFHMLSHTDGSGGQSLLVDGFHCADQLRLASPEAWEILTTWPVRWHASGNPGIVITSASRQPVLQIKDDAKLTSSPHNSLSQVRWNDGDRAGLPLVYGEYQVDEWLEAAKLWDSILKSKENEYWEQLKPGRALIFDNWRVLHGRSVFTGKRRMCGGYINRDDFWSRYLNTNFGKEETMRRAASF